MKETDFLNNIKKKANKMAAHLTEAGSKNKEKEWDRIKIRDEINKEISEFLDAVPDDTISRNTKSAMRALVEKTAQTAPSGACDGERETPTTGTSATGPGWNEYPSRS